MIENKIRPEVQKLIDIARRDKWAIFDAAINPRIAVGSCVFPYIYRNSIKINAYNTLILSYGGEVEMVNSFFLDVEEIEFNEKQDCALQDLRKFLETK